MTHFVEWRWKSPGKLGAVSFCTDEPVPLKDGWTTEPAHVTCARCQEKMNGRENCEN